METVIAVCAPTNESFQRWVRSNVPYPLLSSSKKSARCNGWRAVHIQRPEDFVGSSFDMVVLLRDWSFGVKSKQPNGAHELLNELSYRLR